jgi:hypothetical protein
VGTVPAAGGRRGTFTGGGASVRVGRLIGADRLLEVVEVFLHCCSKALIRTRLWNEDALKNGLFL